MHTIAIAAAALAILAALTALTAIAAYVTAACARRDARDAGRRRLPLRVRDADELGWMDARGELTLPEEVRPEPPARRVAVAKWLLIGAVVCVVLLVLALAARAADTDADAAAVGVADEAAPAATMPIAEELTVEQLAARTVLPLDPFQRCAIKALRGDFGTLRSWQRDAYLWGLTQRVHCCGVAKVTAYGHKWDPAEMAGGTETASGSRVHLGGCAANPELPFGTLIWTTRGLRYVTDRGGWVKLGRVRVRGKMKSVTNARETANLDYYAWESVPTLRSTPWAMVKPGGQTDQGTWYRPMNTKSEDLP